MQISEAARAYAGIAAGMAAHARARPAGPCNATSIQCGRRELEGDAAGPVFAASVLQRIGKAKGAAQPAGNGTSHVRQADAAKEVAQALRALLQAAGPRAEKLVPGLLQGVDAGIAGAKKTLVRLGYDATQVASAAARFRERVGVLLAEGELSQPQEAAAVRATHVRKERGSIELVTQDGDVVRIRFHSRESERVQVAGVSTPTGSALSARIASEQSARLKVVVSGDLDAGELAVIEDFLGKVDALASGFYDGDIEAAFAAGAALAVDPEEIARYAVRLSVSERFDLRARVQGVPVDTGTVAAAFPAKQAAAPAPVATQAATAPAVGASADPVPDAPAVPVGPAAAASTQDAAGTQDAASPQDAASETDPVPVAAAPKPGSWLDGVREFVLRVLEAAHTPLTVHGVALAWHVKITLSAALLEAARPDASERPGATLLAGVLDRASARAETVDAGEMKTAA